jgi:hypothetical protein
MKTKFFNRVKLTDDYTTREPKTNLLVCYDCVQHAPLFSTRSFGEDTSLSWLLRGIFFPFDILGFIAATTRNTQNKNIIVKCMSRWEYLVQDV